MKEKWAVELFDSRLLGVKVGKVWPEVSDAFHFFEQSERFFVEEEIGLVFCYAPFDVQLARVLKDFDYYPVATRALYRWNGIFQPDHFSPSTVEIVDAYIYSERDPFLLEVAADLAEVSHYGKDSAIEKEKAVELYEHWIKNSFDGYAHQVFTALDEHGRAIGLLSLRDVNNDIVIDLLGVHKEWRKQGVASLLLERACSYACKEKKGLCVGTQMENVPANRFYQKNGFLLESVELVYHKIVNGEWYGNKNI